MKKTLQILKSVLLWLLVIVTVGMMVFTIFTVSTVDKNDRAVFGYKFFIVLSDSMSATDFSAGDIIFVKEIAPATLKEGDIVTYISQNPENFGEIVTHKIRRLVTDANGNPGFITYGTTTNVDDETVVTHTFVVGKYTGRIPALGKFFQFVKTTPGYILCILIPFLLLIGYNALQCLRLFRRYKREQMAEILAEKMKIEEERRQSAEMMKELQALREQLSQNGAQQPQAPQDTDEEPKE